MFDDPIGPGTKAWEAFDRALETARDAGNCKRYYNQRQYMMELLSEAGADGDVLRAWCWDLKQRIANGDF